jgi:hypothetical protein
VKYYLDEDISPKVVDILTGYQIDTKSSHEVGMNQSIDIEQQELAVSQGRCFVTRNRNDLRSSSLMKTDHTTEYSLFPILYQEINFLLLLLPLKNMLSNIHLVWNLIQLTFWKVDRCI